MQLLTKERIGSIEAFFTKMEDQQLFLIEQKGELILRGRKGQLSPAEITRIQKDNDIVDFIKAHKGELVNYLRNNAREAAANEKVDLEKISAIYELSPLQEGMLFHDLYDEEQNTYTEQFKVDFPAGIDRQILQRSFFYILNKHSILRSSFIYDKLKIPVQCVYRHVALPLAELDFSHYSQEVQQEMITQFYQEDRQKGFDFAEPPLMRVTLIRLGEDHYRMVWTYNHILVDGWSLQVLVGELLKAYQVYSTGETLPSEEDRYEDFIHYIRSVDPNEAKAFWMEYMHGFEAPTLLPFLSNQQERTKGRGVADEIYLECDEQFTEKISRFVKSNQLTTSTLIQAVWSFLVSKYTDKKDTVIGVTVSGRPSDMEDAEQRVGLYINALPVRSRLYPGQKITDWLGAIQKGHTQAREFQYSSLNDIQHWNNLEGVLFDNIIVFEKYPIGELLSQDWLLKADNAVSRTQNNYTLSVKVSSGSKLHIVFSYYETLLGKKYAEMIRGHFHHVLCQIVEQNVLFTDELEVLTPAEKHYLLTGLNKSRVECPQGRTILDLFKERVLANPDGISVAAGETSLTNSELEIQSNQLARYLLRKNVGKGSLVGICMNDQLDRLIVGILAILKTGAAYLPIDPEIPEDRRIYIAEEADMRVMISHQGCGNWSTEGKKFEVIMADLEKEAILQESEEEIDTRPSPEDLVYVIYTSGSTGRPKGVMITHHNLLDYLLGFTSKVPIPPGSSYGLMSTVAADLGNTVLFGSLINGGTLHLFTKDELSDAISLQEYFSLHRIDCIKIVPSHWRALETDKGLLLPAHTLIFGGEALNPLQLERIKQASPSLRVINHYGPTETTIGKLLYPIDLNATYTTIPIGQVFSNSRAYVVAEDLSLCPIGVFGELLLGGDGVASGYLHQPALTKQRFIRDPFRTEEQVNVYRTGDRVRRLPDGNIEFKGRIDNQVKIRGYRVEPGEIEALLQQSPDVRQAVVIAGEDNDDLRLIAYIVPEDEFREDAISAFLSASLPPYMIPSVFIALEKIPLTANGKIDRKALPAPDLQAVTTAAEELPMNEQQQKLAAIWKEVLKLETIGLHDDFFNLGGHSLTAIRLVGRINKAFSIKMPIGAIYKFPTIFTQAKELLAGPADDDGSKLIVINKGKDKKPLFFIPGSTGNTLVYEALGKTLGADQPFYALQPRGFNGKAQPLMTMEEMAEDLIKLVQQVDPKGPYCLGGYSFGGHVAYEMAIQLRRRGFPVTRLMILDSLSPVNKVVPGKALGFPQWMCSSVEIYAKYYGVNITLSVAEVENKTKEQQLSLVARKLKDIGLEMSVEHLKGFINISLSNESILEHYELKGKQKPDVPILLIKCSESDPERLASYGEAPFQRADLGWQELTTGEITIDSVPGNHHTFLFPPNVQELAEKLKSYLEQSIK